MADLRFSLLISKIVGAANERQWSQVHTFTPTKEKLRTRGTLMTVVCLQARDTEEGVVDLASFGKEIIQRLHEQYFGADDNSRSLLDHLSRSAESVVGEFPQVVAEVVVGVILPVEISSHLGVLYLAVVGPSAAVLMRSGRLYRILAGVSSLQTEGGQKAVTASGFVQEGDLLLLGTANFFSLISSSVLQNALLASDPVEASSILAPLVHGNEENSGVAAVLGLVRKAASMPHGPLESEEEIQETEGLEEAPSQKGGSLSGRWSVLFSFLSGIFRRLTRRIQSAPTASMFVPRPASGGIVVRAEEGKRRSLMFSVAMVILLLLVVSVFFGWRRRIALEREKAFAVVWEVVEHQYQEALGLVDLNPLRSRALLSQAKKQIEDELAAVDGFSKGQREKLNKRLEELSQALEQVSGEHRLTEVPVFLDLSLVRPNTYGEVLAIHEDTLVVLDRSSGVLFRIGVSKKSAEPVGGGSLLSGAALASVYAGRGFVLANAGVVEVSLSGKTSAVVIERDPEWSDIVDLSVFGGNLYLLDRGTQEIFRYQGAEAGFGPRTRWLGEGVSPDLSDAVSLAIDGDIWVLKSQSILRFTRGSPSTFSISGLDIPFSQPSTLYTSDGSERVYVLDRGNRRVVVLDKNGEYREQYIWDGIQTASDMVVSEKEGKILLLSGAMIYEIGINK